MPFDWWWKQISKNNTEFKILHNLEDELRPRCCYTRLMKIKLCDDFNQMISNWFRFNSFTWTLLYFSDGFWYFNLRSINICANKYNEIFCTRHTTLPIIVKWLKTIKIKRIINNTVMRHYQRVNSEFSFYYWQVL